MTNVQLGPTPKKVLEILQQNRGTPYGPDDVCEVADCSTGQAQLALETLANAGLIERQQNTAGRTMYVAR